MPSTSTRRRPAVRPDTRRPPGRRPAAAPAEPQRPLTAPFAAFFGVLVAAEDVYLAWLLAQVGTGWHRYLAVPVLLAVWAGVGAVLVLRAGSRGSLVLAGAAVPPLLAILGLAVVLGMLGEGGAMWSALLLLVGPVGCLILTLGRPVRTWTRPQRTARSRGANRSRGAVGIRGAVRARAGRAR
jgi:hypothetical protein